MVDVFNLDILNIHPNELHRLLYNSTLSIESQDYDNYVQLIDEADLLKRWELWQLLQMNQRVPFLDLDQFTNSDVNSRLKWIMSEN